MKQRIRSILLSIIAVLGLSGPALLPVGVFAQTSNPTESISKGVKDVGGGEKNTDDLKNGIKTIVGVLLFILGAIAVIMIIIGGIRYTTSNGDASSIKAAKDTILYAVIGLIVAILAYAIVNFVIDAFGSK